jgi:6,7-dimethyl-8-ribityllumazine synthase
MSKIVVVHTSWYEEYINDMKEIISEQLSEWPEVNFYEVPGSLELAAMGKTVIDVEQARGETLFNVVAGVIFCGVVVRGETTHYELVTTETFREIGNLALDYPHIAIINNVICVENEEQLKIRNKKNTLNNVKALKNLAHLKNEL